MRTSIVFLIVVVLSAAGNSLAENAVILDQKDAPLKIVEYKAVFTPERRSTYASNPDEIRHSVKTQNVSNKSVVAYQIGLVSFDAFNGFMGKFAGWAIDTIVVDGKRDGTWSQRPYAAFSFQNYGTGVAYVNAVRFDDGTIWRADMAQVLLDLQQFEKSLKKEDLIDKKGT